MIVASLGWVSGHWKMLLTSGTIIISGGTVTHGFVNTQIDRIEALEQAQFTTRTDVAEIKCMIISHHMGEDPLECTLDR